MMLRGIDFGPVLDASGVRGFFGEGYWFHHLFSPFGLRFNGSTFVAKTTTLHPREGNMLLKKDGITPRGLFPKCVVVKPFRGIALNAVGLSGPGAKALFETGRWQERTKPFFLSFMAVGKKAEERREELEGFLKLFESHLSRFQAPVGLQINVSCPNVGHEQDFFAEEARISLELASRLGIPLMPKFSVVTPVEVVRDIVAGGICDAICISNTIPWGELSETIDWEELFGTSTSPLAEFGGGGLSGEPLLPLVAHWIQVARDTGFTIPINAGGGILEPRDVDLLRSVGADSVFLGSIAMLRGWRVASVIERAHRLFRSH